MPSNWENLLFHTRNLLKFVESKNSNGINLCVETQAGLGFCCIHRVFKACPSGSQTKCCQQVTYIQLIHFKDYIKTWHITDLLTLQSSNILLILISQKKHVVGTH